MVAGQCPRHDGGFDERYRRRVVADLLGHQNQFAQTEAMTALVGGDPDPDNAEINQQLPQLRVEPKRFGGADQRHRTLRCEQASHPVNKGFALRVNR